MTAIPPVHASSPTAASRRRGFTLVELLVVIAIIGVLVALLLPAIQAAREAGRRTQCLNNQKNIALACLNYEASKGEMPPGSINTNIDSGSGLGWTVLILPYIEQSGVSQEAVNIYRRSADAYGADMDALNGLLLAMYLCPSDQDLRNQQEKFGDTAAAKARKGMSYAGVSGSYHARTGICPPTKAEGHYCISASVTNLFGPNNFDGLMVMDWPVNLKEATDGTSTTFLTGERTYQIRAWMIGAYWTGTNDPPRPQRSTETPKGPQPSTAFFACKNLSDKFALNHDPYTGCYMNHDNRLGDRPEVPDSTPRVIPVNSLPFASLHAGGVNFSFGDASVRFISESIDVQVYLAHGSRNGDELIPQ